MTDIALETVQIIWDAPDNPDLPKVALVNSSDNDDRRYHASWGACNTEFNEADPCAKLVMFLAKSLDLIVNGGIDPQEVHEVISQVPEYRRAMYEVGGFDPEKV